jgi:hypothetical protein
MLIFPEAYGLTGNIRIDGHFDRYDPEILLNSLPCEDG